MKKNKINKSSSEVNIFVIGDIHFKADKHHKDLEFSEKLIKAVEKEKPDFTVILGDTLDKHERAHNAPFNLAYSLIENLSKIGPVYLLIGNHDLINQTQFLTDKHFFNPLKRYKNITVVDRPILKKYKNKSFVFCPYVEPGRFEEALNKLEIEDGEDMWEFTDCIFAHQEFFNCKKGGILSDIGDKWNEDYPPVISGHMHDEHIVGNNIFYTGSSQQHGYGETSDKKVWLVTFSENTDSYFDIKKINLGLKGKKTIYLDVNKIDSFNTKLLEKYDVKLSLKGTSEEYKAFRESKTHKKLSQKGIKFNYNPVKSNTLENFDKRDKHQASYLNILKELVEKRTEPVKELYKELYGHVTVKNNIELVFHDSEDEI